ncbi:unnamed protein product [Rhodiola kirilowii]
MQSPPVREEEGESQSQKTTPFTCPYTVTLRRNPVRKARPTPRHAAVPFDTHQADAISEFPIDDVLSIELPPSKEIVGGDSCSGESQLSEDLKVFLRIRPLKGKSGGEKSVSKDGDLRLKRNAWPKAKRERDAAKDKKLMSSAVSCIVVNDDSRSVTVSPPFAQQDARRTKTEVYEGFSQVFEPESSQEQVYDTMMKPLVEDFMKGKSGMLVAMGPSGSGKTHTVFGCPRDPGMVPLALRQIFQPNGKGHSTPSRSFYLTIFEISSERSKGEKILDLLTDGTEVGIYQSTIKGLQETVISNVAQAESVIAFAMLKRSTAMTKANSQSSRSQCIINIHLDTKEIEGESGALSNSAVLTIIDLAGAERSKRIGLQGKQLGESNFINNTSMVFGLCLRLCFESQSCCVATGLQKENTLYENTILSRMIYYGVCLHFVKPVNKVFTRLLRRQEENEPVKSEEEDYSDTSFVLRQASPYMQIKFAGITQPDLSGAKRHSQALARCNQAKRVKVSNFTGPKDHVFHSPICIGYLAPSLLMPLSQADRKGNEAEFDHQLDEEATVIEKIKEPPHQSAQVEPVVVKEKEKNDDTHCNFKELQRSSQIMQNFAKAIWNVLKKCTSKLKSNPTDNLICDTSQSIGSARELDSSEGQNLEACLQFQSVCDTRFFVTNTVGESRMDESLEGSCCCDHYSSSFVDSTTDKEQVTSTPHSTELTETEEHENAQQSDTHVLLGYTSPDRPGSTNIENDKIMDPTSAVTDGCCYLLEASHDKHDQKTERSTELVDSESIKNDQQRNASVSTSDVASKFCSLLGSSQKKHEQKIEGFPDENAEQSSEVPKLAVSYPSSVKIRGDSPQSKTGKPMEHSNENKEILSKKQLKQKDDECDKRLMGNDDIQTKNTKPSSPRLSDAKPKRRLMPASTVLLRDMRVLDLEDESDNRSKGNRGRKKTDTEENQRTQGSINLLRILKSNLHR